MHKGSGSAISSIDGRYHQKTSVLAPYLSEVALMKYRVMVEGEYLIALSTTPKIKLRKFTTLEKKTIRNLYLGFNDTSFEKIKELERKTNHDVKAVEYFIKDKLSRTSLKGAVEWVHFGLTSEDINNLAYALMLADSLEDVLIPEISKITSFLTKLAKKHKDLPILARTHGQAASPSTFGKEIRVFVARLKKMLADLSNIKIQAKLNGASGNYNAHSIAYPKVNWPEFSKKFIHSFNKPRSQKLETNLITTQIECHDNYVAVFDTLRRINTILIDLDQDIWRYISDGWIGQKQASGEVGSSTMPHKINPIDFENSEGNLGVANALFEFYARKLPISRLQRDLSDSTVERTFGTAFSHSLLGYHSLFAGLNKIKINRTKIIKDLNAHPEVIAEAIQTVLRREGVVMPYEKLKELTRGREVTLADIHQFIDTLEINSKIKKELKKITPENYTGLASQLTSR